MRITSQEFGIPKKHHLQPIDANLLIALGNLPAEFRKKHPGELALSLVMIEGDTPDNGQSWDVTARSAHLDDRDEPTFGSVRILVDSGGIITPSQALDEGEAWIRESETTLYVPGGVSPLPVPNELQDCAVAGMLLVRASAAA